MISKTEEERFLERSPEGAIRQIERPDNIRSIGSSAHLFVKLNGGISYYGDLPEQVSIERAHFERLAARIPAILPRFLRPELQRRSLLALGHGLAEPDVRALIEYAAGNDRTERSWAVQKKPLGGKFRLAWEQEIPHWSKFGLKILDADLERFIGALCCEIVASQQRASTNTPSPGKRSAGARRGKVFISYPRDASPRIIKRIASGIIERGFKVWLWDKTPFGFSEAIAANITSLRLGDDYVDKTLQAAAGADAVLYLISPWTPRSEFQAKELQEGLKGRSIVPCIVSDEVDFGQLPDELRKMFVAKVTEDLLSTKDGKARICNLIEDVSKIAATRGQSAQGLNASQN